MDMDSSKASRLQVVMKKTTDITPFTHNPRKNERTAMQLQKSIKAFGFKNPIILDENDVIVSGHARLKAALMLGMEEVPCIYAKGLSPDEIRAFRIADNKTAEIAGWDYDKLCEEMTALTDDDFDLAFTGFNEAEQFGYGRPDAEPTRVDADEYKDYKDYAEDNVIQSFNVSIVCESEEDKEYLRQLFNAGRTLKRLYRAEELYELRELAATD